MQKYLDKKSTVVFLVLFILMLLNLCIFLPWGHDSNFHVMRIGQEATLIKDLGLFQAPFYIYPEVYEGYGYGSPMFYCDLFFYPFALLASFGVDTVLCYKIMVACIACTAFFISYFCVYQWKKDKKLAFICAMLFSIQPYFLLDLFTRAAIGEALALCFEPLVVYGIYSIFSKYRSSYTKGILCLGVGMGLCVLSHLISSFLIVIALVIFCLISIKKIIHNPAILLRIFVSAIICLGISAWFWAPMLEQMINIKFQAFEHNDYFLNNVMNLYELLIPYKIRYKLSANPDSLEWFIGGAIFCPLIVTLLCVKTNIQKNSKTVIWLIGTILVLTIVMISKPICTILYPIIGNIRLPWRLMIIVTICTVLLSIILLLKKNYRINKILLITTFVVSMYTMSYQMIATTAQSLLPDFFKPSNEIIEYSSNFGDDLYLPIEANRLDMQNRGLVVTSNYPDLNVQYSNEKYCVSAFIPENNYSEIKLEFPRVYYLGYKIITGEIIYNVGMSENGLVEVSLPGQFSGKIQLKYLGTSIQKVSKIISLVTLLLLIFYVVFYKKIRSFICKKGFQV